VHTQFSQYRKVFLAGQITSGMPVVRSCLPGALLEATGATHSRILIEAPMAPMELKRGSKLGPYEIVSPIGAGGMGAVWKAHDPRLNRHVAIKVSDSRFSERFGREARAVAALNHPNICQIYDVGPDYIVMEYIDGAPPRGPLAPARALKLALGVAAGLEAAHERGITHRDLKPANILITRSGVKLLDFGLARMSVAPVTSDAETVAATIAGTVLGTAGYMSPEQAQGKTADARSDIFSFGLVLYELLSGRRAFTGNTAIETIAAVLHKEPEPLDTIPPLQIIVTRCLRKVPGARFQTMSEVRAALEQVNAEVKAVGADNTQSIAVLPFANMSRDPDDEYFSDGLAEEILNAISRVSGLRVTFFVRISWQGAGHQENRRSAGSHEYIGGQRPAGWGPPSGHSAANQCRRRISSLVGALRTRAGGCVRGAG
jgi:serine/threonine protein kinase